jgi:hypothetical protein
MKEASLVRVKHPIRNRNGEQRQPGDHVWVVSCFQGLGGKAAFYNIVVGPEHRSALLSDVPAYAFDLTERSGRR